MEEANARQQVEYYLEAEEAKRQSVSAQKG